VAAGKVRKFRRGRIEERGIFNDDLIGIVAVTNPQRIGLLYDTDWNWRVVSEDNGKLRAMGDIGSHWMDMIQHLSGLPITSVCADLATFHQSRKRPKGSVETFSGKKLQPSDYEDFKVTTDDFGAVLIHLGDRARGAFTVSQMSAGRKNNFAFEIFGTKAGVAWAQEQPILGIGTLNDQDVPEVSGRDHLADLLDHRIVAQIVLDAVDRVFLFGEIDQFSCFGRRHREGLLAEDSLSRLNRCLGHRSMVDIRRADVHGCDFGVGENLFQVCRGFRYAKILSKRLSAFRAASHHCRYFDIRQPTHIFRMHFSHKSGTDDSGFDLSHR
jgi:hypothetical protein